MKTLGIRDIIGPIMIGPSSSHTAGALRIALMARHLLSAEPAEVEFRLYGSPHLPRPRHRPRAPGGHAGLRRRGRAHPRLLRPGRAGRARLLLRARGRRGHRPLQHRGHPGGRCRGPRDHGARRVHRRRGGAHHAAQRHRRGAHRRVPQHRGEAPRPEGRPGLHRLLPGALRREHSHHAAVPREARGGGLHGHGGGRRHPLRPARRDPRQPGRAGGERAEERPLPRRVRAALRRRGAGRGRDAHGLRHRPDRGGRDGAVRADRLRPYPRPSAAASAACWP